MVDRYRLLAAIGGRRAIVALGSFYVAVAIAWTVMEVGTRATISEVIIFVLIAGPGAVISDTGYRLAEFDIRTEFYPAVAGWCLGGLAVMLAVLGFYSLQPGETVDDVSAVLILTALASVAGLAAGVHNAQAQTRTRELGETIEELEASNEQLERYKQYTDDILDAVDDVFYVVARDGSLTRWNESLTDVTGYTDEEIASMSASDFFEDDSRDEAMAAVREGFETGSVHVELDLRTKDGETIPFEFAGSTLSDPWGDTILAGIGRDVSERVEREQRLEELVDRLEESNERLEQFAYAASHDLQEPLRMVSSYLQLIQGRYADELDEDGEEFIEFAVDGADRMRSMIEGLLQYSRVETQGDPFEPVDLDEVVTDVRSDLQVRIDETGAEITVEDLPVVEGDRGQLRQVFQNLIDNAIDYSGDDRPHITVSAGREGNEWLLSVRDEGIGIDPDDRERIFEVFQSLHPRNDHSGTGIGLALCERIIERHGGDIWVDSEPGEGSTFTFTLPVERS